MSTAVAHVMAGVFERNLYEVADLHGLPLKEIHASLRRDRFACLRGLISARDVETSRQALSRRFSRHDDHPSVGESPRDVQRNFQKLSVGGLQNVKHVQMQRPKLVRTFYNPFWEEDVYLLHHIFRRMAAVRNLLAGKHTSFATSEVEDGLWTAARMHQYPTGGGFMGLHKDVIGTDVIKGNGLDYYQVILAMSRKGIDFDTGGGFLEHDKGTLYFEDYSDVGDLIVYDGFTSHGVEDIDPHKPLDLDSVCGRLAAFVSLYRNLP